MKSSQCKKIDSCASTILNDFQAYQECFVGACRSGDEDDPLWIKLFDLTQKIASSKPTTLIEAVAILFITAECDYEDTKVFGADTGYEKQAMVSAMPFLIKESGLTFLPEYIQRISGRVKGSGEPVIALGKLADNLQDLENAAGVGL